MDRNRCSRCNHLISVHDIDKCSGGFCGCSDYVPAKTNARWKLEEIKRLEEKLPSCSEPEMIERISARIEELELSGNETYTPDVQLNADLFNEHIEAPYFPHNPIYKYNYTYDQLIPVYSGMVGGYVSINAGTGNQTATTNTIQYTYTITTSSM